MAGAGSWLLETLRDGALIASTVKPDFRQVVAAVMAAESLPPGKPVRFELMADMTAADDAGATGKLMFRGKKAVYAADLLPLDDLRVSRDAPSLF